jgi:hypothetical protein
VSSRTAKATERSPVLKRLKKKKGRRRKRKKREKDRDRDRDRDRIYLAYTSTSQVITEDRNSCTTETWREELVIL